MLRYLAPLRLAHIVFGAVPKLPSTQILHNAPNSTLHIVVIEAEWLAIIADASKSYVDVRVVGIEVADRHPLEPGPEVLFHLLHQAIGQTLQVDAVTEFRRDYELPKALVARSLPLPGPGRDIAAVTMLVKAGVRSLLTSGALSCDIAPVGSPLSFRRVRGIHQPDSAALIM